MQRRFFIFGMNRGYTINFDAEDGAAETMVWDTRVERLEYSPNDPKKHLLPLWLAHPGPGSVSIYWRMSYGESYKDRWHDWYRTLNGAERAEYKGTYPPPNDDWKDFYELVADTPSDGGMGDLILGCV